MTVRYWCLKNGVKSKYKRICKASNKELLGYIRRKAQVTTRQVMIKFHYKSFDGMTRRLRFLYSKGLLTYDFVNNAKHWRIVNDEKSDKGKSRNRDRTSKR